MKFQNLSKSEQEAAIENRGMPRLCDYYSTSHYNNVSGRVFQGSGYSLSTVLRAKKLFFLIGSRDGQLLLFIMHPQIFGTFPK